ncbi:uncharacterized protein SPPG_04144 [Spizellomyces punctatus DAOM BR117]|uniref:Dynein regulatory complex protein 1 n=1 Tax=Spizellomyces punctatus (strain DAOM BR117) TaxID=645134 RepID=A0A0L0HIX0_SPIPD|nr:uncharacterized protein SPPG_04144 [Spizellomyces punctatus DAOM BR117]KND01052.1 hypothetical protein SPPG_04144 [Spizellomyces punctatus DAOM BR117]|eukprot:XP_016609091.1 hypothetical protein SPPG_04144 [Spizellomyces punctatus DAOM BR117]
MSNISAQAGGLNVDEVAQPHAGTPTGGASSGPVHGGEADEGGVTVGGEGDIEGEGEGDASREARIASRKRRMEARRLARMKPEKMEDASTARRTKKPEPSQAEAGKSKSQVSASKQRIESTKQASNDQVTSVRVSLVAREDGRRQEEARKVQQWNRKRDEERNRSSEMGTEIEDAWNKVLGTSGGPYELYELLTEQKHACGNLIGVKNKLIEEYVAELKSKDDEYVKELKRQAEEIDALLSRMEANHRAFQTTLREELEQIERAFVEERTELIDANVKDVDTLFETRAANEAKYMEERGNRVEDHVQQLEALRVHDAEEYNLVKIKLETDVQVLEQQLQQMRATYQLNTEKLEYNFQVLKKRDEENGTILGAQKRKITRLTDHLNTLKAKLSKQEKTYQQEYMGLTDDYKRITEQFKELQKKFRHFQVADGKKFREVWQMNEEMAKELMRKLLQADQIIHEQQLGLPWSPTPSPEDLFRTVDPSIFHSSSPSAKVAAIAATTKTQRPSSRGNITAESSAPSADKAMASTADDDEPRPSIAAKLLAATDDTTPSASSTTHQHHLSPSSATTKRMLDLLCTEASFLVEEKLQKLLVPLQSSEQSLMKLDSIFKALGVESMEDMERLMGYFIKSSTTDAHGQEEVELIGPNEVVGAVRKFVEDKRSRKVGGPDTLTETRAVEDDLPDTDLEPPSDTEAAITNADGTSNTQSRSELLRSYWQRMANVIDDDKYRVWTAVHAAMTNYNAELVARYNLTQQVEAIQQQNDELKGLLRQYMGAQVNDELHIPPAKILMAQAGVQVG